MERYPITHVQDALAETERGTFTPHSQIVLAAEVLALRRYSNSMFEVAYYWACRASVCVLFGALVASACGYSESEMQLQRDARAATQAALERVLDDDQVCRERVAQLARDNEALRGALAGDAGVQP